MRSALPYSLGLLLGLPGLGCDKMAAGSSIHGVLQKLEIVDAPVPAAELIDELCDNTNPERCSRETLSLDLPIAVRRASERPGSHVRLWMLAATGEGTTLVADVESPIVKGATPEKERLVREIWIKRAQSELLDSASPLLSLPPPRQTPLAEALTKIALAPSYGVVHRLLVQTDGREHSAIADLERHTPTEKAWLAALDGARALEAGSLTGSHVYFTCDELTTETPGDTSVRHELAVRSLWDRALRRAGATSFTVTSGAVQFDEAAMARRD